MMVLQYLTGVSNRMMIKCFLLYLPFFENADERLNSILTKIICKAAMQEKTYLLSNLQIILELPKFKTVRLSIHFLIPKSKYNFRYI